MENSREMSLDEWAEQLPRYHSAREELSALRAELRQFRIIKARQDRFKIFLREYGKIFVRLAVDFAFLCRRKLNKALGSIEGPQTTGVGIAKAGHDAT